ncbi:hypothetical protein SCLCIDRAFT_1222901 [Scleroderma citrinum Foug A]|uniref:Uncharacterized protein n=1 Tax=Scleroderma citrinum Foug A TaxID=1036808 RepID=A0A0C3DAE0_9AGAM|nr:hypothetical protein SCLCIDRAFT_1222901 [Scleroderma citrinum Foug A]
MLDLSALVFHGVLNLLRRGDPSWRGRLLVALGCETPKAPPRSSIDLKRWNSESASVESVWEMNK